MDLYELFHRTCCFHLHRVWHCLDQAATRRPLYIADSQFITGSNHVTCLVSPDIRKRVTSRTTNSVSHLNNQNICGTYWRLSGLPGSSEIDRENKCFITRRSQTCPCLFDNHKAVCSYLRDNKQCFILPSPSAVLNLLISGK